MRADATVQVLVQQCVMIPTLDLQVAERSSRALQAYLSGQ